MFGNFNPSWEYNKYIPGGSQFLGGLIGSSQGFDAASKALGQGWEQAQQYQKPFWETGVNALPQYNKWLQGMQNPSDYLNNLMGQYQQSPWAKFQTQQGIRAANNAGSASGLIGSTPLAQSTADYARNISSQDQNNWLQNVLGINNLYGQGQFNLANIGQNSANSLTNYLGDYSRAQAEAQAKSADAGQNDMFNMIGGGLSLLSWL